MDLSCARKFDYYLFDLVNNKLKACCKTPFYNNTTNVFEDLQRIVDDRIQLKNGTEIENCNQCWQLEKNNFQSFRSPLSAVKALGMEMSSHGPKLVEFLTGNLCNLKCVYCGPAASSQWNGYSEKNQPTKGELSSEIIALIESWWPSTLKYTIIGGEPLLTPETFKIIDTLAQIEKRNPSTKQKRLALITNLSVPTPVFRKKLLFLKTYCDFFKIQMCVSIESIGKEFEYIRDGASFDVFIENFNILLECRQFEVILFSTFSLLSIQNYHEFLDFFIKKFIYHNHPIQFNYNEVVFPSQLSPRLFPLDLTRDRLKSLQLLSEIPSILIKDKNEFTVFCKKLSELYDSLTTENSISNSKVFLDKLDANRINKLNWKDVFPNLNK